MGDRGDLLRLRVASGSWSGASATILARAGVDAWVFGVALTCFTGVYLAAMSSGGVVARRFTVNCTLIAVLLPIGPFAPRCCWPRSRSDFRPPDRLWLLRRTARRDDERRRRARRAGPWPPILAGFHGGASCGLAVGAILGSLMATSGGALDVGADRGGRSGGRRRPGGAGDRAGRRRQGGRPPSRFGARILSRSLVVIGLVVGVSIAGESAAMSWSALLLQERGAAAGGVRRPRRRVLFRAVRRLCDFSSTGCVAVGDRPMILVSLGVAAIGFRSSPSISASREAWSALRSSASATGAIVPCGFALAARAPAFLAGGALHGRAVHRLPAAAGAAGDGRDRQIFLDCRGLWPSSPRCSPPRSSPCSSSSAGRVLRGPRSRPSLRGASS